MHINNKVLALVELGKFLSQADNVEWNNHNINQEFYEKFEIAIEKSIQNNRWFTKENILHNLKSWSEALAENNLNQWLSQYSLNDYQPKTIGLVLAGNIPMVGFHDVLSVWLSGHHLKIKPSSQDQFLIPVIMDFLSNLYKGTSNIEWVERLTDFDATIATGSNNSARYFEYYFSKKPHIIRKNRNSVAILNGKETKEDLAHLAQDIFMYFGLGCRNVSKIYVPKGYDFSTFYEGIHCMSHIIEYDKYKNNYDYNKAVFLMSRIPILDNAFLILKEDSALTSPIAVLHYEYYEDITLLNSFVENNNQIQCVVSNQLTENSVAFGTTQHPQLWDYADGIDTLAFLSSL